MNIEKHLDVINACRFCFMCRHLDPVGNISFRESDTPRGRALILDKVRMDSENLKNPDFIDSMYRSALSAANRFHCVSGYDETGLVLAARQDIVSAGLAPEKVRKIAEELKKAEFSVKGKGDILYYGMKPELYSGCKVISGGDPGKALEVLGFMADSKKVFDKFRKAVVLSKCRKMIVAEPSSYDFLKDKLDGLKVVHCSEYLLSMKPKAKASVRAYYLDSDFLRNYDGNMQAPRELLKACGYKLVPFGTNPEESCSAGEAALVYDRLNPELAMKLCERIYKLMDNPEKDILITASSYTKHVLNKYDSNIKIITVEEAAARKG